MLKIDSNRFLNIIKYPIITDKTTRLLESNQYSFAVDCKANKLYIKRAIESIFNVKVKSVNTFNPPIHKLKVRQIVGTKPHYKRAIVTLANKQTINLFP